MNEEPSAYDAEPAGAARALSETVEAIEANLDRTVALLGRLEEKLGRLGA